MKFDSIIIGGGLAGLACGIRLAESGLRCAIISRGQSALHFSSGSLDLLSGLPDGSRVQQPEAALSELARQSSQHPYSLLGKENVLHFARESEQLLQRCAIRLNGSYRRNHRRMTPLGTQRASWLSPVELTLFPLPWQRVAVISLAGFLDFQADLVAGSLTESGVTARVAGLTLPVLDKLRNNPGEFRAVNIARILDIPENRRRLVGELSLLIRSGEALILPACAGLEDDSMVDRLALELDVQISVLPTLPPSVLGMRMHNRLRHRFQSLGGVMMPGDSVVGAKQNNDRVTALFTRNHREVPLRAANVVLASGSFFSSASSSHSGINEPIFGLDMEAPDYRPGWTNSDLFEQQPWLPFGVKVDRYLHPYRKGQPLENLYAIGSVLSGFDPVQQGCGAGVSLLTALYAAQQITGREPAQ